MRDVHGGRDIVINKTVFKTIREIDSQNSETMYEKYMVSERSANAAVTHLNGKNER